MFIIRSCVLKKSHQLAASASLALDNDLDTLPDFACLRRIVYIELEDKSTTFCVNFFKLAGFLVW